MIKRAFDIFCSGVALLVLWPVLVIIALWIKTDSSGPVFFRQERVGKNGRIFRIHKFRTMEANAERKGLQLTVGADNRVTGAGKVLRKSKIDEIPQLLDVFLGDMSIVGPRPEVPKYIDHYSEAARAKILSVRPGITDRASIEFRNENEILSAARDPETAYITEIMPIKQKYYCEYADKHSLFGDIKIVIDTAVAVIRG
ncbi:sugar transferase [Terasakiella sp.]|uniref:sugar transferase n=1 Tax=Terasakiella sp. TaxID=2034861 RepID=UPI003AA83844